MKDKRFLYITPGCYDKGGISRYNRYQIKALIELYGSRSVKVLSLYGPEGDSFKDEFKVHWHGRQNDILSKIGLVVNTLKHAILWRPDVVLIAHVNLSYFAWLIAKICRAKTVLNVYGLEVWTELTKDALEGLISVDYIISDCHFTADYLVHKKLRSRKEIEVIWDCVDLIKFKPIPEQWNEVSLKYNLPDRGHHFIILTLGRLAKDAAYKGYERLLNGCIEIMKVYPQVRLIFAGKGDLIPELKEKTVSNGISEKVSFIGSVDEEDMAAIYSYAHIFSLVSHRDGNSGEGIPLTPLEAMACGVPIIVGNQDGSREAVINNRNGIVIDPHDLQAHIGFIEKMIKDESARNRLGKEAVKVASEFFSFVEFKEKHSRFFKAINLN